MNKDMYSEQFQLFDRAIIMTFSDDPKVQDEGIKILEDTFYERAVALLFIGEVYEKRFWFDGQEENARMAINKFRQVLAIDDCSFFLKKRIAKLEEKL